MKKALFILFVLFFFSGCALVPSSPTVDVSNNILSDETLRHEEDVAMNSEDVAEDTTLKKMMDCSALRMENTKADCLQLVNDMVENLLFNEIVGTFDISRCDELGESRSVDCKATLEATGVQGPINDQDFQKYQEAIRMVFEQGECNEQYDDDGNIVDVTCSEGRSYYDPLKCDSLSNQGLTDYCRLQVTRNIEEEQAMKIFQDGQVSDCDALTNKDVLLMCKSHFGVFEPMEENLPAEEYFPDKSSDEDSVIEESFIEEPFQE